MRVVFHNNSHVIATHLFDSVVMSQSALMGPALVPASELSDRWTHREDLSVLQTAILSLADQADTHD